MVHFDYTAAQCSHERSPDIANFGVRFTGLTVLCDLNQSADKLVHIALVQLQLLARLQHLLNDINKQVLDLFAVVQTDGNVDYVSSDGLWKKKKI